MSLSDSSASTLMRRGVISETVYRAESSREGGSLSRLGRSLSLSYFSLPLSHSPSHILNLLSNFSSVCTQRCALPTTQWVREYKKKGRNFLPFLYKKFRDSSIVRDTADFPLIDVLDFCVPNIPCRRRVIILFFNCTSLCTYLFPDS